MSRNRPPRLPANYNSFFHPNVCHVCKTTVGLQECFLCRMISYCSEEHRLVHRAQHIQICEVIVTHNMHFDVLRRCRMTLMEWYAVKAMNLRCVKRELCRVLEPYEEQMFLFAKGCYICCQQNDLLLRCTYCVSINTCPDHLRTDYVHCCSLLRRCLDVDILNCLTRDIDKKMPKNFLRATDADDMISFVAKGLRRDKDSYTWLLGDYLYSEKFSRPLTLLHGMRRANLLKPSPRDLFVVHIIAGDFYDELSMLAWEVVLHEFRPNTKLLVLMVGPGLRKRVRFVSVCKSCFDDQKVLEFECIPAQYHRFAASLRRPPANVVIGFDLEFKVDKESTQTIRAVQSQRCPLILTTKTESQASSLVIGIQEILNLNLSPVIKECNKFASYRPLRNKLGCVFFPNKHLIMYRDLGVRNIPA